MAKYIFGVDLGGTTVKIGLFDTAGTLMDKWEIPTRTEESGKYILTDIALSMNEALGRHGIDRNDLVGQLVLKQIHRNRSDLWLIGRRGVGLNIGINF